MLLIDVNMLWGSLLAFSGTTSYSVMELYLLIFVITVDKQWQYFHFWPHFYNLGPSPLVHKLDLWVYLWQQLTKTTAVTLTEGIFGWLVKWLGFTTSSGCYIPLLTLDSAAHLLWLRAWRVLSNWSNLCQYWMALLNSSIFLFLL